MKIKTKLKIAFAVAVLGYGAYHWPHTKRMYINKTQIDPVKKRLMIYANELPFRDVDSWLPHFKANSEEVYGRTPEKDSADVTYYGIRINFPVKVFPNITDVHPLLKPAKAVMEK